MQSKKPAPKPKPDQRNPKGRSSDSTIDERVDEMMTVLSNRPTVHRSKLHKELCERWKCHWKTVDRILGRARAELMTRLHRSKEEFRCESLAFYEAKQTDSNASVTEQLRARQRIDELLGLDAPKRTELSGPEGGPIATKQENPLAGVSVDRLRELALGGNRHAQEKTEEGNGEAGNRR